jgi:hypothetical protein
MFEQLFEFVLPYLATALISMSGAIMIIRKWMNPAKEIMELVLVIMESIEDGKVTAKEMKKIFAEAKDVSTAIKQIT